MKIPEFPVFPPDLSHPLRDDFTERAARHTGMHRPPAGSIGAVPYDAREGPWSGYPQLGIDVPFSPAENNEQTILKLDEWGMPTDWTVALGMQHGDVSGAGFDITAKLFFGSGAATQYVEVDWLNGTSITLPMNALNVIALYNLLDLESAPNVPDDLRLRVTLSRGGNYRRATRSYAFVTGTASQILPVPPFARDILVMPIATPASDAFFLTNGIELLPSNVGPTSFGIFPLSQCLTALSNDGTDPTIGAYKPIPLPPFVRYFQTVSLPGGAPNSLQCFVQFGIAI